MPEIDSTTNIQNLKDNYVVNQALQNGRLKIKSLQARSSYLSHALNKQMSQGANATNPNRFKKAVSRVQEVDLLANSNLPSLLLKAEDATRPVNKQNQHQNSTAPQKPTRKELTRRQIAVNRMTRACEETKNTFVRARKQVEALLSEPLLLTLRENLKAMDILEETLSSYSLFHEKIINLQLLITNSASDLQDENESSEQSASSSPLLEQLRDVVNESTRLMGTLNSRKINGQTLTFLTQSAALRHKALCESLQAGQFDHSKVLLELAKRHDLRTTFSGLIDEVNSLHNRYNSALETLRQRTVEKPRNRNSADPNELSHASLPEETSPKRPNIRVKSQPPETNMSSPSSTSSLSSKHSVSPSPDRSSESLGDLIQTITQTAFATVDWVRQDAVALQQSASKSAQIVAETIEVRADHLEAVIQAGDWRKDTTSAKALQAQIQSEIKELNEWLEVARQESKAAQIKTAPPELPEEKLAAPNERARWLAPDAKKAPEDLDRKPAAKPATNSMSPNNAQPHIKKTNPASAQLAVKQTFETHLRNTLVMHTRLDRQITVLTKQQQDIRNYLLASQAPEHVAWYSLTPAINELEQSRFDFMYSQHQNWVREDGYFEQNFADAIRTIQVNRHTPEFHYGYSSTVLQNIQGWLQGLKRQIDQADYFTQMAKNSILHSPPVEMVNADSTGDVNERPKTTPASKNPPEHAD